MVLWKLAKLAMQPKHFWPIRVPLSLSPILKSNPHRVLCWPCWDWADWVEKSHRPLSYRMHSSLGCIASLTGSCGILFSGYSFSNAVVLSPHLPQLKKEKYSPHQPKGGISDVIASFRLWRRPNQTFHMGIAVIGLTLEWKLIRYILSWLSQS